MTTTPFYQQPALPETPRPLPGQAAPRERRWAGVVYLCLVTAALGGAVVLFLVEPTSSSLYPPCVVHKFTGLHCPGCGTTRGLHALLHGRVWAAFRYNPLMVLSLPFFGLAFADYTARLFSRAARARPRRALPPRLGWCVFWVVLAFTVLRNLPFRPFSWLAPTSVP